MGINGTFSWEELPAAFINGAVAAGTAALSISPLTATQIANGAKVGILRQVAGSSFVGGAAGGGMAAALTDSNWEHGIGAGLLNIGAAMTITGFAGTALPLTVGAGIYTARAALPFARRIVTATGTTVTNLFDGTWVRSAANAMSSPQAFGTFLETTLNNWATHVEAIGQRLIDAAPTESELTTRQALRDILNSTTWTQIQRDSIEDAAINTFRTHRGQLPTLQLTGTRTLMEDGTRSMMAAMNEGAEALRVRVNGSGVITGGITDAQLDTLARNLAALDNSADDAAIRAALQDPNVLGASAVIPDELAQALRELVTTGGGFNINHTHVFLGEINRRGRAVGFHHRPGGSNPANARIVVIVDPPNAQGVYRATVEIFDPSTNTWVLKNTPSTFFPDSWSQARVLSEIRDAFANKDVVNGTMWEGVSSSGIRIRGYLDAGGQINTAYAV